MLDITEQNKIADEIFADDAMPLSAFRPKEGRQKADSPTREDPPVLKGESSSKAPAPVVEYNGFGTNESVPIGTQAKEEDPVAVLTGRRKIEAHKQLLAKLESEINLLADKATVIKTQAWAPTNHPSSSGHQIDQLNQLNRELFEVK